MHPASPARRPDPPDDALAVLRYPKMNRTPPEDDDAASITETPAAPLMADHIAILAEEVILRVAAQAKARRMEASGPRIAQLVQALLADDDHAAEDIVRDARLDGMPPDTLYHGLVAGAVKSIGAAWSNAELPLQDVVHASFRVREIMRGLREVFVNVRDRKAGQEAVFALCPGETHSIGLTMTADDLRRRGWHIELLTGHDHDSLMARLERIAPATVALGATTTDMVLPLARMVVALRAQLPGTWVMIGGRIVELCPDIVRLSGADAAANTTDRAEQLMQAHLADLVERRVNRL